MSEKDDNALLVERLVGDRGDPERVMTAARACAERALPALMSGLNSQLAAPVAVEVSSVDVLRIAEARPGEESNDIMVVAAGATSPDALLMVLDPTAVAVALSAMFGGDPDLPVSGIDRPLSRIERQVAVMVFRVFAEAFNGSGDRAFDIRFPLPAPLCGDDMQKLVLRDGPGVRMNLAISMGTTRGTLSVTMPQRVLLKHRGDTGNAEGTDGQNGEWRARFSEEVMRSAVRLEATIPLDRMTLGDIAGLKVGQVIEMPKTAQSETRLSARDRTVFVCEFGKLGQNYTVRVRHPYDEKREFINELMAG